MQSIRCHGDPKVLEQMGKTIEKYGLENIIPNLSSDNIKHNINIRGASNRRNSYDIFTR